MRSNLYSSFTCVFFCLAIGSFNVAADQLTLPLPIIVRGNGVQVSGQLLISNPDYAILSNTAFVSSTQGEGTYTDLVGPSFTVVPPNQFVPLTLGSFQFAPGTPLNAGVSGTLSLFYTLYSVNPNSPSFDPIADYVSNDQLSSPTEAFINQQTNSGPPLQAATPEPGSWALAAAGLLLVLCSMLRKLA